MAKIMQENNHTEKTVYKKSDFYYELPEELIAQTPAEPRDSSRLLVYSLKNKTIEDKIFHDLPEYLRPGDVLVVNDTRVIPARIYAKTEHGGNVEVLLLKRYDTRTWEVLMRPGKKGKIGVTMTVSPELSFTVKDVTDSGERIVEFTYDGVFEDVLSRVGTMPLPPYIHEKLKDKTRYNTVYSKVDGVGYELYCSASVFSKARFGAEIELYVSMHVKEDGITLFGFDLPKEKELFARLTSVSGVGPKSAMGVFTSMSADEAAEAIMLADVKKLSKAKGLGKKTAEKIVLELHGKISAAEVMSQSGDFGVPAVGGEKLSDVDEEAVSALQNLGFTRNESVQAVKRAKESGAIDLETIIRRALQG